MKVNVGTASLLIAAGTAGLTNAYPTPDYSAQVKARDDAELSLRVLFDIKQRAEEHADLVTRAYEDLENQLYRRWGKGDYTLDDDTYHRQVKPKFISEFNSKKFKDYCGNNPDFFIEKDGTVYPAATASKQKKDGKCTKKEFSKNLGHIVLAEKPQSPSPSPSLKKGKRDFDEFEIYRRWGKGDYTIDDDTYHREVKPKFISEFNSKKFKDYCGSNPDFFIEKDGSVYPSATASKQKKDGKCTKKEFNKNLGHIVLAAKPRSPSPEPAKKGKREFDEFEIYRRWGKGDYTLDDDTYHREVKPKFISEFNSKKFKDYCGNNPDFFIEKDGSVYPAATASKQKKDGKCTKKEFTKNLGHIVLAAKPRSQSPEPAKKGKREYYEIDQLD